jgi:phosphopantetheine adenylyltransferase
LKEVNLQALVVTEETEETAKSSTLYTNRSSVCPKLLHTIVIRERVELGLPDIDVITVDLLCTGKEKLSSTNIRKKLHG